MWFWHDDGNGNSFSEIGDSGRLSDAYLMAYLNTALGYAHGHGTDRQIELLETELLAHGWL